jgi:peroxin-6
VLGIFVTSGHAILFCCHQLGPETGGKEENNINVPTFCSLCIVSSNRYLPTILLLRHFDVFQNLGSYEGSPNDQVGVTSEVASVIRKFTEPVTEDEHIYSEGEPNGDSVRCKMCYFLVFV